MPKFSGKRVVLHAFLSQTSSPSSTSKPGQSLDMAEPSLLHRMLSRANPAHVPDPADLHLFADDTHVSCA